MMKNKKLMVIVLALAMAATMFTGCFGGTPSSSEASSSESSSVVETPAETIKATGVVKEMSMSELVVTLEDGSEVTLKVEDLEGINDIALGDTIEVEYAEDEGVAVATSVKAAAKVEDYAESENAADEQTSAPDAQNPTSSTPEAQTPASSAPATSQPAASQPAAQAQAPAAGNTGTAKNISGMTDKERAEALFDDWEITCYDWETPATYFTAAMSTYTFEDIEGNVIAIVEKDGSRDLEKYGYGHYQNNQVALAKAFNDVRGVKTICGDSSAIDGTAYVSGKPVVRLYDPATDTFSDEWTLVSDVLSGNVDSKPADKTESKPSGGKDEKPTDTGKKDDEAGSTSSKQETESASVSLDDAVELLNEHRAANGIPELVVNDELMELAAVRAEELTESYSHRRPDGTSITGSFGYGEIITKRDTADAAIQSWKDSSSHNRIMLDSYGSVGVGYYNGYWVMIFGA